MELLSIKQQSLHTQLCGLSAITRTQFLERLVAVWQPVFYILYFFFFLSYCRRQNPMQRPNPTMHQPVSGRGAEGKPKLPGFVPGKRRKSLRITLASKTTQKAWIVACGLCVLPFVQFVQL